MKGEANFIEVKNLSIKFKVRKFRRTSIRNLLLRRSSVPVKNNISEFWALNDINFSLNKGDILGVIGTNGSGKSTLLRALAGVYSPDKGTVKTKGTLSSLLSLSTGFRQELSGIDNIYLTGVLTGFKEKDIAAKIDEIVEFSELGDFIHRPVKTYSSGMRSRLGFSIAVSLKRDIMMIDEILGVGDYKFQEKSKNKMLELINEEDRTIIIVSHNRETIAKYTNKCLWIEKGVQKAYGATEEILDLYQKEEDE